MVTRAERTEPSTGALVTEVAPSDYAEVCRRPARRSAIACASAFAGLVLTFAPLSAIALSNWTAAVGFARERGVTWSFALVEGLGEAALQIPILAAVALFGFGLARQAGRGAALSLRRSAPELPHQVEGLSVGEMRVSIEDGAHVTELRHERYERHLRSLSPATARHGLVLLPAPDGSTAFFRADGAATARAGDLRTARRAADPGGWPLPRQGDGWLPFWLPVAEADAARSAATDGPGGASTHLHGTLTATGLALGTMLAAGLGWWLGGGLTSLAAVSLLLPFAGLSVVETWQAIRAARGRGPRPGGTIDGVTAGEGALKADGTAIHVHRRYARRRLDWAALDCVTEVGDHLLLKAAGLVVEVLPNDPAVHYAMGAAGLRPATGPWADRTEGRTWHLSPHA